MSSGEPELEIVVRASTPRAVGRRGRRLLRRPLAEVLADLHETQRRSDALLAAGEIAKAGELAPDLDRLTQEVGRRRLAPSVRPPL